MVKKGMVKKGMVKKGMDQDWGVRWQFVDGTTRAWTSRLCDEMGDNGISVRHRKSWRTTICIACKLRGEEKAPNASLLPSIPLEVQKTKKTSVQKLFSSLFHRAPEATHGESHHIRFIFPRPVRSQLRASHLTALRGTLAAISTALASLLANEAAA